MKFKFSKLFVVVAIFTMGTISAFGQVNPNKYFSAQERYERAIKSFFSANYDDAYDEFMRINYNDTAYFASRYFANRCLATSNKYDTIVENCTAIIKDRRFNPYKEFMYRQMINAHVEKERYDEALSVANEAIETYEHSGQLYFQKGMVLKKQEKYSEALVEFQKSVRYSPTHTGAHRNIGDICLRAGELSKAAMAYNMVAFLSRGIFSAQVNVGQLTDLYEGNFDQDIDSLVFADNEDFATQDGAIRDKVAASPMYKVTNKFAKTFNFIKFNKLMFESLEYKEDDYGFWNQTYVQFYRYLVDNNMFDYFTYIQLENFSYQTQKKIKKYRKKLDIYHPKIYDELIQFMNNRMVYNGTEYVQNKYNHYGDYGYNEIRTMEGDEAVGPITDFDEYGLVTAEGVADGSGKINGEWTYYEEGVLVRKIDFLNSKVHGKFRTYYANGSMEWDRSVKDGKLNGYSINYYAFNQPFSKVYFNEYEKEEGDAEYYYGDGTISRQMKFKDGKLDGPYTIFHPNGTVKEKLTYKDGNREGDVVTYHMNGKERVTGSFKDDKRVGHWKYLYDNGQVQEEGEYKDDYRVGVWKTYNKRGKISEENDYGPTGKKTGVYKNYDKDGNLILELTYKESEIISYKTFDSRGNVLKEGALKKKELEFENIYDNGKVFVRGNYMKGEKFGLWQYFSKAGLLTSELNYNSEGQLDGEAKWYFENGSVETVKKFRKGLEHGYYVDYYKNGQIYNHGWYQDGIKVGEWENFYRDGTLESTEYYIEGELHGEIMNYDEKGKLVEGVHYFYGTFMGITRYDTTGAVIGDYMLKDGAIDTAVYDMKGSKIIDLRYKGNERDGDLTRYHSNGKISVKGQYEDGMSVGHWEWYDRVGRKLSEGDYEYGVKVGEWKWYHHNGKLRVAENYVDGEIQGVVKRYYEDGSVESERTYLDDEYHGDAIYYDPSGEIQYIRIYEHGVMKGYTYLDEAGNRLPMIPFNNMDGTIEAFFKNGKISYHSEYKNGYNEGSTIYYNSNGNKCDERTYKTDAYEGKYIEYFPDGKVRIEANYVDGEENGEVKVYYSNGKLRSVENFIQGKLYGNAKYYTEDGKLIEEVNYYNGR